MNKQVPALLTVTMVVFGTVVLHLCNPEGVVADGNDAISTKVINIKNFGAIGDGVAMETKAIQNAIDASHDAGGGIVRVPAGDFPDRHDRVEKQRHAFARLWSQSVRQYQQSRL